MINWQDGQNQWGADVETWRSAGADYVSMRAMGAGFESPQDHIDALRTFWDAVN